VEPKGYIPILGAIVGRAIETARNEKNVFTVSFKGYKKVI
jgi:hypothetical protein